MKLEGHFDTLLTDTVDLSKFRLERLEARAERIYDAIRNDEVVGAMVVGWTKQGSWAQETIINPPSGRDFDADFTLRMKDNPEWDAREYLRAVRRALKAHHVYQGMTLERKNRCVRVVYSDGFHVDVVPAVVREGAEQIAFYQNNSWERTNPEGFTAWMRRKDASAHANLRRSIRLMKYVRDHRGFTGVRSILLTTLMGDQVNADLELDDADYYRDVPTTFTHLLSDLDEYIWSQPAKPTVQDPSGTGLTFDHRWEDPTYENFRERLHSLAETAREALGCDDDDESERLWRIIFGDAFKNDDADEGSGRFGKPEPAAGSAYAAGRAG